MIFALETSDRLVVEAYTLSDAPTAIRRTFERNSSARAEMTALFYEEDLERLGLDPGIVPASTAESSSRLLPPFDVAVVNRLDASDQTGWRPLDVLDGALAAFRTPDFDFAERCAARGGCYDSASGSMTCLSPCPESEIEPVRPPAALVVECPAGWELEPRGRFCDPYPEGELECDDGTFQRPGDSTCQPVGRVCPEPGTWPTDLPESSAERPVLFVDQNDPGREQDADGSIARPFHRIGLALEAAESMPNTLVMISEGTYSESLVLRGAVSLRGTCATATVLQPTGGDGDDSGTVISVQGTSTLEDLTLQRGAYSLVVRTPEARLRVLGVRARYAAAAGLLIQAGDVVVEDTELSARYHGIELSGGNIEARRIHLFGAGAGGVAATGGRIALDAARIERNVTGLVLSSTARATVARSVVRRSDDLGVYADADARFEASSSMFGAEYDGSEASEPEGGVAATGRADVVLTNAWFVGVQSQYAVLAFREGTSSKLEDLAVVDCLSSKSDVVGVHIGGSLDAARLRIDGCAVSLLIDGTATASITDAHFSATDRCLETAGAVSGERWQCDSGRINATQGRVSITDLALDGTPDATETAPCVTTLGTHSFAADRLRLGLEGRDGLHAKAESRVVLRNASVVGNAWAIRASDDAQVELERFDVRASLAAFRVSRELNVTSQFIETSRISARRGVVHDSQIGALIPGRTSVVDLFDHVRYVANDRNFVYYTEESSD